MNVVEYMNRVPDYTAFPSVDALHGELAELATAHPDLIRHRHIGTSRLGDPLHAVTVGDGPADAVVIAGPHPNEPVGALTALTLIKLLCEDSRFGFRWHVVVCADPDGARLNEGWYSTPGDRHAYAKHFYRPDLAGQVEWTFPLTTDGYSFNRPLPETQALMRLMDEVRPALVCSLHNGEYQGAFFYLNRDDPTLAQRLATLPGLMGLPIHHGQPELPGATAIGPGAYLTPAGSQIGKLFGAGGSSADYAATFGALHLMPEVPTWADARIGDQRPSGHTHGQILAGQARRELVDTMAASMLAVASDLSVRSPFRRSIENTLEIFRTFAELGDAVSEPDRPATVAEAFGSRQQLHLMRLRLTGTFLRMLDAELAAGNHTAAIREQHRLLTGRFAAWYGEAEAESPGPPVELRKLVAVQLGAILTAAERVTSGELL